MENWKVFQDHINSIYNEYQINSSYKDNVPCQSSLQGLQTHQAFLGKYAQDNARLKLNNGLLIFHGMGSGKTCTSIAIAEGLKATDIDENELYNNEPFRSRNNIIITTPAQVVPQYKEEILEGCSKYIKINNKAQYYGDLSINDDIEALNDKINENAKKIYIEEENLRETIKNTDKRKIKQKIKKLSDILSRAIKDIKDLKELRESKINNTYTILSHDKFIDSLLKDKKDNFVPGKLLKKLKKILIQLLLLMKYKILFQSLSPLLVGELVVKNIFDYYQLLKNFLPQLGFIY